MAARVFTLAACVDEAMPTEPAFEARSLVADSAATWSTDQARASLVDAADRILPVLEDAGAPPGRRDALVKLADRMGSDPGSARADLVRAQGAIEAATLTQLPGMASEIDAIGLALAAAKRAM